MTISGLSLTELAAYVSACLRGSGVEVVVVGGSAITTWAPDVYTSNDIDFAVLSGDTRKTITTALAQIGFVPSGRIYVHPECMYTLDFVANTPYIDGRAVSDFAEVNTLHGQVLVYHLADAIADRVAHFVHWSDNEALHVAERTIRATRNAISGTDLERSISTIAPGDRAAKLRVDLARRRLLRALDTASRTD